MSAFDQARLWILQQRRRQAERALEYADLVGSERPILEADLHAALAAIHDLRTDNGWAESGTAPLCDHVRTVAGEWVALEDAVSVVAGVPCAGFIRAERLEGYWAGRIQRFCELPVTAIADAGHIDRMVGRLKIVVVVDPWADGELRARVLTRAVPPRLLAFDRRELVLLTA